MAKLPNWHPHLDDAALERVLAGFDASLMNDAKWVRLLDALSSAPGVVLECHAKLVWQQEPCSFRISGATFGFDYYDRSVESLVTGSPAAGWHRYKEIEWLEFPPVAKVVVDPDNATLGMRLVPQDLSAIRSRLDRVGTFDLRDEPSGLRLYAYLRLR